MRTAECRSCHASIVWATTEKGKAMPVNAQPDLRGDLAIMTEYADGAHRYAVRRVDRSFKGERYTSHFATCPFARRHSRQRGGRP